MYCSTCGSRVVDGRATCQVCGGAVARSQYPATMAAAAPAFAGQSPLFAAQVQVCPRCGYRGLGAGYFSKGTHVAGLVISGVMFLPAALLYVLVRHNHKVCPACGMGWGSHGMRALTMLPGGTGVVPTADMALAPSGGRAKKFFSVAMLMLGALMVVAGLANLEFAPILFGMLFGGAGGLLMKNVKSEREERRDAILQSLQLPVLQLAGRKGGRLTVTDVATEMGWPMARAEKVLNSLDDGMRVMSDITDDGVIVYDFLEIRTAGLQGATQRPELRLHA
jgi:hypothetical protein